MHIYFKRSGGFSGIPVRTDLDTSSLTTEEAETIEQMLAAANFFDLPSDPAQVSSVDRFSCELRVVSGDVEHTVCFSEQDAPAEISTLMRHLTILARRPAADISSDLSAPEET